MLPFLVTGNQKQWGINSALRALKAVYDGVQLHGCHSYSINEFSSVINLRTSDYMMISNRKQRSKSYEFMGLRKYRSMDGP